MAFKPSDLNNFTAPDANYPYGSSKDETAPGVGDGSEYKKARADDIFGFQQALLAAAAIVPSGNADTALVSDYLNSIKFIAGKNIYSVDIDYAINSNCQGSDGIEYKALLANGPSTAAVDPVGNPLTWENALVPDQDIVSNGYIIHPTGPDGKRMIEQWGKDTADQVGSVVVYPITFPNLVLNFTFGDNAATPVAHSGIPIDNSSFTFYTTSVAPELGYWRVIGY